MRRVTRNGVIAVAAASGAMAVTMPAYAGSAADGAAAGSPGVLSGNTVQLPVHVPVNLCGNTVDVVGLLNPAAGNRCGNEDAGGDGRSASGAVTTGEGARAGGGARSGGDVEEAPGVLSGNGVRLPVGLPVNVSGNSVNVVGVGNASVGNESVNAPGGDLPDTPDDPDRPTTPTPGTPPKNHPGPEPAAPDLPDTGTALARTGADQMLPATVGSAALLLGGAAVYRRFRPRGTR
ncbi:chaplin [Streptomyces sp. NPDC048420]|uniref:chaplin n=1 Tax=Streptomyces sp. NPDC048420 TaxID=3155755 RepID=UPI003417643A